MEIRSICHLCLDDLFNLFEHADAVKQERPSDTHGSQDAETLVKILLRT